MRKVVLRLVSSLSCYCCFITISASLAPVSCGEKKNEKLCFLEVNRVCDQTFCIFGPSQSHAFWRWLILWSATTIYDILLSSFFIQANAPCEITSVTECTCPLELQGMLKEECVDQYKLLSDRLLAKVRFYTYSHLCLIYLSFTGCFSSNFLAIYWNLKTRSACENQNS